MESLQGAINPCNFLREHLDAECFEQGFVNHGTLRCGGGEEEEEEEEEGSFSMPILEDKMPFLQMLQSAECPPLFPLKEPNFQTLLRLQHMRKPREMRTFFPPEMEAHIQAMELESCVTHEILDLHSPVKSETKGVENRYLVSSFQVVSSEAMQAQPYSVVQNCCKAGNSGSPPPEKGSPQHNQLTKTPPTARERKKRKRTKPTKNKEEVESQRMTHIAVERNRRRQMNDHLNSLRSLMPPSYIQRGDQASIIGSAIDFVKELEQLLRSLEEQKRTRSKESNKNVTPISAMGIPQSQRGIGSEDENCEEEVKALNKAGVAEVELNVIQNHVNLKIQCPRRPGQLLQAIITLEGLRLTVLHLNITSSQASVFYSFNLKMEDDCKLTADEIETTVHQIFR